MTVAEMTVKCKRCLLEDIDKEGLYKKVGELIMSIPDCDKTPSDVYVRRLAVCKECESLENGLCRECGCFVELRAAMRQNRCPSAEKKWDRD